MFPRWNGVGLLIGAALLMGCASTETVEQQRRTAQYYDPYPQPEPGPGMTEVRPPEFAKPRSEPVRAQWQPWWLPGGQR